MPVENQTSEILRKLPPGQLRVVTSEIRSGCDPDGPSPPPPPEPPPPPPPPPPPQPVTVDFQPVIDAINAQTQALCEKLDALTSAVNALHETQQTLLTGECPSG